MIPKREVKLVGGIAVGKDCKRITDKAFKPSKLPAYAYRDRFCRSREQRILNGEVQQLLARDTQARVLQTGEHLLEAYDRTFRADGGSALAQSAAVDWSTVPDIHLSDSNGTLHQNLHVGPAPTAVPFHHHEKQYILGEGDLLECHNSNKAFRGGEVFMSWAQIAVCFNLSFEGQVLNDDPKPRPRRSRQSLKDEFTRLKRNKGRLLMENIQ